MAKNHYFFFQKCAREFVSLYQEVKKEKISVYKGVKGTHTRMCHVHRKPKVFFIAKIEHTLGWTTKDFCL
jgi:hypothetical protein